MGPFIVSFPFPELTLDRFGRDETVVAHGMPGVSRQKLPLMPMLWFAATNCKLRERT